LTPACKDAHAACCPTTTFLESNSGSLNITQRHHHARSQPHVSSPQAAQMERPMAVRVHAVRDKTAAQLEIACRQPVLRSVCERVRTKSGQSLISRRYLRSAWWSGSAWQVHASWTRSATLARVASLWGTAPVMLRASETLLTTISTICILSPSCHPHRRYIVCAAWHGIFHRAPGRIAKLTSTARPRGSVSTPFAATAEALIGIEIL
jgi:hypothetical protein